jgi:hypothetical protein
VARLFISQAHIDRWVVDEKVVLDGDLMNLPAFGTTFQLQPAIYFLREVSDDGDKQRLLGRVKPEAQVRAQGGELYAHSVIIGEAAYDVETGFLAEAVPGTVVSDSDGSDLSEKHIEQLQAT